MMVGCNLLMGIAADGVPEDMAVGGGAFTDSQAVTSKTSAMNRIIRL
jgi:hypothetical protein